MPFAQSKIHIDPLSISLAAGLGVLLSVAACALACGYAPDALMVSLCTAHGRAILLIDPQTGAALNGIEALAAQICPHCALVGASGGAAMAWLAARTRLTHIKAYAAL
ncbi:hypothetical protein E6W36_14120 [Hankyongella ginsenosidimutans]|uniref:Uncharacterized protein n=1 Tax=Hankyongella ginsenosidimutans TaxID=1763828 RepID=A0A4D7C555_9SPHN|nr:hypothetical protein [Hankyongella ginsenosidimutans]QCI80231.1 hypothetical protein E6W36_14120 [Hankyongella ginsenosidimutans]